MNSEIFDSKGAVEFLGITSTYAKQTLHRMVRQGKVKALLLSRKQGYRFHRKALEDALLSGGRK